MKCNIGLKSEFEWYFDGASHSELYGKGNEDVLGVADKYTQQAWIFIDKIAIPRDLFSETIKRIVSTTVHELIHLCGYGEDVAERGEELLIWDGWSWCHRPLVRSY
jgi:hypothetical protein